MNDLQENPEKMTADQAGELLLLAESDPSKRDQVLQLIGRAQIAAKGQIREPRPADSPELIAEVKSLQEKLPQLLSKWPKAEEVILRDDQLGAFSEGYRRTYAVYRKRQPHLVVEYFKHHLLLQLVRAAEGPEQDDARIIFALPPAVYAARAASVMFDMAMTIGLDGFCIVCPGAKNTTAYPLTRVISPP